MPIELFDYQREGAARLINPPSFFNRFGLLDDPGVGKSAQTIRAMDDLGYDRNILVVPASARKNWVKEFGKFSRRYRRYVRGVTIHDFVAWRRGQFDTIITSYEQAAKWAPYILDDCDILDSVTFDEAHRLRNEDTKQVKALLGPACNGVGGLGQWAKHSWWLTGTPIWNDPQDIWTFLRYCGAVTTDRKSFLRKYFNGRPTTYSVRHSVKPAMLQELRSLIEHNSIKRTLEQAGVELPPLFFTTYDVEGDTQHVRQLLSECPGLDQAIIDALREDRGISGLDADHIETLRRLIGEAKAVPYAHMLLSELQSGIDKMVVMAIHRNALHQVRDVLWRNGIDCGIVNGETTDRQDEVTLARFDSDPTLRVLACNIRKAGTALNMTVSAYVDVLESDWTPPANAQAIRRVYRLGQTRTVRARFISLADSFDEIVTEVVAQKAENIAALQGPII